MTPRLPYAVGRADYLADTLLHLSSGSRRVPYPSRPLRRQRAVCSVSIILRETAEESTESQLDGLLDALAPRLRTPKADVVAEVEMRLTALLGVEAGEAFRAVAVRQQHAASSLNLDRIHKSGLVLLADVLGEAMNRTHES